MNAYPEFGRGTHTAAAPNFFVSASQICDVPLVPLGYTASGLTSFWSANSLTGDNSLERPYSYIYPRVTTKSNIFTVHVLAQSLKQTPADAAAKTWYENKDQVLSEYRGAFTIEKYFDPEHRRSHQRCRGNWYRAPPHQTARSARRPVSVPPSGVFWESNASDNKSPPLSVDFREEFLPLVVASEGTDVYGSSSTGFRFVVVLRLRPRKSLLAIKMFHPRFALRTVFAAIALAQFGPLGLRAQTPGTPAASTESATKAPVVITDNGDTVTLENGLVSARIRKADADLTALQYKGLDLLAGGEAYWNVYGSTPNSDPKQVVKTQKKGTPSVLTITQDPKSNGGEMGEVELLFPYKAGSDAEPLDIAIRYTLRRGDSGVYGWTSVTHRAGYPAFDLEANTVCLKLNPKIFDHLTIDSRRNKQMINGYDWMHGEPLNLKEARRMTTGIHTSEGGAQVRLQHALRGNPDLGLEQHRQTGGHVDRQSRACEYLSNGPDRVDYGGHIDLKDSPSADPTLLFIWHSFHFGGAAISINEGEEWNKVVGPFLIYCNSGADPRRHVAGCPDPRRDRKGRVALRLGEGAWLRQRGGTRCRQRPVGRDAIRSNPVPRRRTPGSG